MQYDKHGNKFPDGWPNDRSHYAGCTCNQCILTPEAALERRKQFIDTEGDKLQRGLNDALDEYIDEIGLDEGEAGHLQRWITDLVLQADKYAKEHE